MIWGKRRPRLGEPVRAESFSREDVVRRPQADMLIDDLFAQQMRADGEQRGAIEVGLIITWSRRHNAYATGRCTLWIVVWSTYSNVSWGLLVVYRTYGNVPWRWLLGA